MVKAWCKSCNRYHYEGQPCPKMLQKHVEQMEKQGSPEMLVAHQDDYGDCVVDAMIKVSISEQYTDGVKKTTDVLVVKSHLIWENGKAVSISQKWKEYLYQSYNNMGLIDIRFDTDKLEVTLVFGCTDPDAPMKSTPHTIRDLYNLPNYQNNWTIEG